MEEQKKGGIGGTQGLALLIAVIALVLALIAIIRGGPTQAELQNMMQAQFDSFSQQLISQFKVSMDKIQKLENELKLLELQKVRIILKELEPRFSEAEKVELQKIHQSLDALEASISGKPAQQPQQGEPAAEQPAAE